ncbi:glycoside hydrolase family 18 protein [Sporormia fimetaria CBS 119925]|uniref:chitinase n=1 Tax=Sporormia fimetaria CBS 119925 TaxID=1340428 RepID=A0A6A6VA42_9PLEO|nr:glycoside hydrolase family 18 protein [Sporormia fimetaria CBS 119925]
MRSQFYLHAAVVAFTVLAPAVSATFNAASSRNLAVYWGQGRYQIGLEEVCDDDSIDIVNIGFVNKFPTKRGEYPGTNFANACGAEKFRHADGSESGLLKSCPSIGPAIKKCQAKGKKVLLSIGGGYPTDYYLPSQDIAEYFADFLWGAFGPETTGYPRPFGDAAVDGFDLDLEAFIPDRSNNEYMYRYYDNFVNHLRNKLFPKGPKTYYISGAPQCVLPDARLSQAISKSNFDFVFVQFYNTPQCSSRAGYNGILKGTTTFTMDGWASWLKANSLNKKVKLYIGLPASEDGVESDKSSYLHPEEANLLISYYAKKHADIFGGVMLWEATLSVNNNKLCARPYGSTIKDILIGKYKSGVCPPKSSTIVSSTSTSSSSSSSSTVLSTTSSPVSTTSSSVQSTTSSSTVSTTVSTTASSPESSSSSSAVSSSSSAAVSSSSSTAVSSSSSLGASPTTSVYETTTGAASSTDVYETTTDASSSSTAVAETTTDVASSTEASTEATSSTEAASSTDVTSSTIVYDSTTDVASSTVVYETTTDAASSTVVSETTTDAASSTVVYDSTTHLTSSTFVIETPTDAASSTSVYDSTTDAASSTGIYDSTTDVESSTSAHEATTDVTSSSSPSASATSSAVSLTESSVAPSTHATSSDTPSASATSSVVSSSNLSASPSSLSSVVYPSGTDSTSSLAQPTSSSSVSDTVSASDSASSTADLSSSTSCTTATTPLYPDSSITSSPTLPTASSSPGSDVTKTITTTYVDICSTGLTTVTTTITKTVCGQCEAEPTTSGVPKGWYTTVTVCTQCGPTPTIVTLTKPADHATKEYPAPMATGGIYTPGRPGGDAHVPAPEGEGYVPETPEGETYVPEHPELPEEEQTTRISSTVYRVVTVTKVPVPYTPAPYAPANSTGAPEGTASSTGYASYPTYTPPPFEGAASGVSGGLTAVILLFVGMLLL